MAVSCSVYLYNVLFAFIPLIVNASMRHNSFLSKCMELHGYKEKVNRDVGLSKTVCFHSETNIKLA